MPHCNVPKISHHKASGQAVVRLDGRDFYLGSWGTEVARGEYDRIVAEWLANGRHSPTVSCVELTVAEIMLRYVEFADGYYRSTDGTSTTEPMKIRHALRPLRRLYGHTDASAFGPLSLKAVQQSMITLGWCRKHINQNVNIIRRMFKWAVENELVPGGVYHALLAVSPLKSGRSAARESEPVKPAPDSLVRAVLPVVSRQVAAMIRLQRLTGMRPGEVVRIRGIDIDTTGPLWLYRPSQHKTRYLGHERVVFLGPQARKIVEQFLKPDTSAYLFSPTDAEAERRAALSAVRTTPPSCGNRPGTNQQCKPQKKAGSHYSVKSYARAVQNACDAASPLPEHLRRHRVPRADGKEGGRWETPAEWKSRLGHKAWAERHQWLCEHRWHPHQLRHTTATELRKNYGLEAAQVILGHKTLTVTQIYAEKNVAAAMRIMAEVG
ncbi:MAG: site-specific integrase [Tepidisphaeraceae bacterium]|jgi:integrase